MASKTELAQYIRFQLSQLRSLNKHHMFEDLARQFARLRICENILPATGPVGTGGDQGRDFETYRSCLAGTPIATSSFLGRVANSEKKLVFACSVQEKIVTKIKSDVSTICGSGEEIDAVYYFCEANLPVAKRHELQQWSRDAFNTELEVFDGQALSEQLTDLDVFWIAEEYLDVPAEMYPRIAKEPTSYTEYKGRWLSGSRRPYSYADFFQVKYGIRAATFETFAKPDLLKWIATMEIFRGAEFPKELQRRATYEICVAALRGQDNLTAKRSMVEEYFSVIDTLSSTSELEDATVLLSYCSSALLKGHFEIAPEKLIQWSRTLIKRLEDNLKIASNLHVRCSLLQNRGYAALLQLGTGPSPIFNPNEVLKWWLRLVKEVSNAPLFPLEHFANLLCKMTEWIGEDPKFRKLAQQVDELLSARSSGYVAANKCRERALTYYKNKRYLLAIQELHQAKVKWFSAETLHGSLLAMLLLSTSYHHIGLPYAAKYYAACVAYLAYYYNDDHVKRLIPKALFSLADHCYGAGEWLSFLQVASLALSAHNMYDDGPSSDDEEADDLDRTFGHTCILKAITQRLAPALGKAVNVEITRWPIDLELHTELAELATNDLHDWQTMPIETFWTKAQQQLSGRPFCDLGTQRTICWKALGINWSVHFENDWSNAIMAEELVATLQILLADLAGEDLCLLPTTVKIQSFVTDSENFAIKDEPNNQLVQMNVTFPRRWVSKLELLDELRRGVFAIATATLRQCSMLSDKMLMKKIENAFSQGLAMKVFAVRPYSQIYGQFMTKEIFDAIDRNSLSPLEPQREFEIVEHQELGWITGPGPGYSPKKAQIFLKNRYKYLLRPIRLSLPHWLQNKEFQSLIRDLREEGYLDWQILLLITNIVLNYRIDARLGPNRSWTNEDYTPQKQWFKEETEEDATVPVGIFTPARVKFQKQIMYGAVAKTWGLEFHRATPDSVALKKLLDTRYGNAKDDIAHEDIFCFP